MPLPTNVQNDDDIKVRIAKLKQMYEALPEHAKTRVKIILLITNIIAAGCTSIPTLLMISSAIKASDLRNFLHQCFNSKLLEECGNTAENFIDTVYLSKRPGMGLSSQIFMALIYLILAARHYQKNQIPKAKVTLKQAGVFALLSAIGLGPNIWSSLTIVALMDAAPAMFPPNGTVTYPNSTLYPSEQEGLINQVGTINGAAMYASAVNAALFGIISVILAALALYLTYQAVLKPIGKCLTLSWNKVGTECERRPLLTSADTSIKAESTGNVNATGEDFTAVTLRTASEDGVAVVDVPEGSEPSSPSSPTRSRV